MPLRRRRGSQGGRSLTDTTPLSAIRPSFVLLDSGKLFHSSQIVRWKEYNMQRSVFCSCLDALCPRCASCSSRVLPQHPRSHSFWLHTPHTHTHIQTHTAFCHARHHDQRVTRSGPSDRSIVLSPRGIRHLSLLSSRNAPPGSLASPLPSGLEGPNKKSRPLTSPFIRREGTEYASHCTYPQISQHIHTRTHALGLRQPC